MLIDYLNESLRLRELIDRDRLVVEVAGNANANPEIPAGYTYLGQFVVHDLTRPKEDRGSLLQPKLDLVGLYGAGPGSHLHGNLYQGPKLRLGCAVGTDLENDLPLVDGKRAAADPRNDENLIVSQLTVLFAKFHNLLVDRLFERNAQVLNPFATARRINVSTYKTIVRNELLPKLFGQTAEFPVTADFQSRVCAPLGIHAFRACHAMVQEQYSFAQHPNADFVVVRNLGSSMGKVTGNIDSSWVVDWQQFFFDETDPANAVDRARLQRHVNYSRLLQPRYTTSLDDVTLKRQGAHLLDVDMLRISEVGSVSAQEIAEFYGIASIPTDGVETWLTKANESVSRTIATSTPLPFYLLCEAMHESNGKHFGSLGRLLVTNLIAYACYEAASRLNVDDSAAFSASSLGLPLPQSMSELITLF